MELRSGEISVKIEDIGVLRRAWAWAISMEGVLPSGRSAVPQVGTRWKGTSPHGRWISSQDPPGSPSMWAGVHYGRLSGDSEVGDSVGMAQGMLRTDSSDYAGIED